MYPLRRLAYTPAYRPTTPPSRRRFEALYLIKRHLLPRCCTRVGVSKPGRRRYGAHGQDAQAYPFDPARENNEADSQRRGTQTLIIAVTVP